jgi:FkbH-like protein
VNVAGIIGHVEMADDHGSSLRDSIDAAIAADDVASARELIERLWRQRRGPAVAGFVNGRLAKLASSRLAPAIKGRSATVAILRSFTVEPIVPLLRAAAGVNGIDVAVHIGDFNTYTQEILDPQSSLYTVWAPDVVILAVQTRDIAPDLWGGFAGLDADAVEAATCRVLDQYANLVSTFRSRSTAHLLIHGLERPPFAALGLADRASTSGQVAAIERINSQLVALADSTPGVHVVDYDGLVARVGRTNFLDERKWLSMKMPIRAEHMAELADEWLRYLQPICGRVAKAIVVDLDNTLWGGVVGEDGAAGIQLGEQHPGAGFVALQRTIRDLAGRGILLGICSKNNEADALEVLERHPDMVLRPSDFSAMRINWENKADNLRSIAAEWNIGLDSIAFLDDNPAECALVRRQLPDVIVIELDAVPEADRNPVIGNPFFERLTLTDEDRSRTAIYAQQRERSVASVTAGSLEDYLESLATVVTIKPLTTEDTPRIAQLTQKTNQFNLTTRRYSEQDLDAFVAGGDRIYSARAADRFGDHGLIGVVIARPSGQAWRIDTLLLSCRVIGRGVETAMVARVVADARASGASEVVGEFVATAKNAPARPFYESVGFDRASGDDQRSEWSLDVTKETLDVPAWLELSTAQEGVVA